MIALIDSDSICYGNAFSVEKDGELIENADKFLYSRLESSINRILADTKADDYKLFLTSGGGFRKEVDPNYKANRSGMKRPILLQEARDYLIVVHEALTYDILEADDAVCIEYNKCIEQGQEAVIAHIDKDINQQPGLHYRWPLFGKDGYMYHISEVGGLRKLYKQALVGDKSDNIMQWLDEESGTWKKDYGLGDKGADKVLEGLSTEKEMYQAVLSAYSGMKKKSTGEAPTEEDLHRNMQLLYMRRTEDDEWRPPV